MTALAAATRERLLEASLELIDEGGYGAATVAAIAGRAGLATGTLYRHFASKESLFVELFRAVCDREFAAMQAAAEGVTAEEGALVRLLTVLETFAQRALRRPRRAWAIIAEPVDRLVEVERLAYRARYATLVEEVVRHGVETGELPEQDARFTAAALIGGCAEALVGPLAPAGSAAGLAVGSAAGSAAGSAVPDAEAVVRAQRGFVCRAVGAARAAGAAGAS